ncbi:MAG: hypothetical protein ACE5WD_13640 [Candidatus Aminicenantia bacterium]
MGFGKRIGKINDNEATVTKKILPFVPASPIANMININAKKVPINLYGIGIIIILPSNLFVLKFVPIVRNFT